MADDEQEDVEITSNANKTINNTNIVEEEDDELELSLSLRPLNNNSSSFSLPSIKHHPHNHNLLTKRDAQALRRHEAKLKRDLKRKTHHFSLQNNDALLFVNNQQQQQQQQQQRCTKVPNLGFHVGPPWLGWNNNAAACFNGVVGFPPFQGQNCKFRSEEGDGNNGNGNGNGNDCGSFSSGSSSGISDNHHSLSGAGANSSDAGSHSSHPHSQLPLPSVPSTSSQLPTCSSQLDLQPNDSDPNHSKPQLFSSYSNKIGLVSSSSKSAEGATTSSNTACQQNGGSPTSDKDPNTTPRSIIPKEDKGETGKPPRPNGLKGQQKPLSSEMPCVSTTGNGPNGKTVTGFLYKYTKTEVSIICVCHGSSFSPAEFVEHAGGVDVEYPLRHIRVVPFALG